MTLEDEIKQLKEDNAKLEASCAAMRDVLWQCGRNLTIQKHAQLDVLRDIDKCLSSDAGASFLAELNALKKIAKSARKFLNSHERATKWTMPLWTAVEDLDKLRGEGK